MERTKRSDSYSAKTNKDAANAVGQGAIQNSGEYYNESLWLEDELQRLSKEYNELDDAEHKLLKVLYKLQEDNQTISLGLQSLRGNDVDSSGGTQLGQFNQHQQPEHEATKPDNPQQQQQQQPQRNQKEKEALERMEHMLMMDDDSDDNESDS